MPASCRAATGRSSQLHLPKLCRSRLAHSPSCERLVLVDQKRTHKTDHLPSTLLNSPLPWDGRASGESGGTGRDCQSERNPARAGFLFGPVPGIGSDKPVSTAGIRCSLHAGHSIDSLEAGGGCRTAAAVAATPCRLTTVERASSPAVERRRGDRSLPVVRQPGGDPELARSRLIIPMSRRRFLRRLAGVDTYPFANG